MTTHVAILTFDGFNELDSLIALALLNRVKQPGWRVTLCCPTPSVTSMNGVVLNQPFHATGNVATAGGCLAAQYLAAWVIARTAGLAAAKGALHYVAPVGQKDDYVERAIKHVAPFVTSAQAV